MAIVEFVNKPNRTYAGMKAVIKYILNPDKTMESAVFEKSVEELTATTSNITFNDYADYVI